MKQIERNDLTRKAMLVRISIGMPGNSRKDKEITGEVQTQNNMTNEAGKWQRQIYPKSALEPFIKIQGEARTYHYTNTLPWGDEGLRILPAKNFFRYTEGLKKIKRKFEDSIDTEFCAKYDEFKAQAKAAHGAKFREQDYPGCEYIRPKFRFDVVTMPMPDKADFRVDLAKEEIEEIQNNIDKRVSEAISEARKDVWERLIDPVRHLLATCRNTDTKRFHRSLTGNILDASELVPNLNLSDDSNLERMAQTIANELGKIDVESLRDDEKLRADTASKAEELLKQMEGYI